MDFDAFETWSFHLDDQTGTALWNSVTAFGAAASRSKPLLRHHGCGAAPACSTSEVEDEPHLSQDLFAVRA